MNKYIAWFENITKEDGSTVGGKGANLGEMTRAGIPVPYGFVVTSNAYFDYIRQMKLGETIRQLLEGVDVRDAKSLQRVSKTIENLILKTPMPKDIATPIMSSYLELSARARKKYGMAAKLSSLLSKPYVAVRSSATAEDLPGASFAGQQATFLNISGEANVVLKVQEAWASLFTARAIFYREEKKFDHMKVGVSVPVQLMVNSQASGVMFTIDPVTNEKNKIVVEGIYGLGELIVQGAVTPDHFEIDKKTWQMSQKKICEQRVKLVKKDGRSRQIKLSAKEGKSQKVSDSLVVAIAKIGAKLEKHYFFPQDVEWAVENGIVYIVQTRPITTIKSDDKSTSRTSSDTAISAMKKLLTGDPASPGIAWGRVKILKSALEIDRINQGDILVTAQTNPDFVPAMKKAVAIVTETGGRTSHAAIVSRELGIAAVVGATGATKILKNEQMITVNGSKGEVYEGVPTRETQNIISTSKASKVSVSYKTATKIYVNMASPSRAAEVAKLNVDGVGLLRAEFMIADIGTHPKKLIKDHKEKLFITKLAADLLKFCEPFNPRPVVYRATDFKTNEYRNLIGGKEFEPVESNPMLGYRGAYRYMTDPKVFNLELETIKLVRNKYGFKNLHLMLPFVRTVRELIEVKKIIAASGLCRSASFKLWMMVEIPSNVILLDQFCEAGIDGVSIGSNDLTMLILGTDRDNSEVAPEFDERNPAVLWAIEKVVRTCKKYGITCSICGQAPSDYPELVEMLVKWGITSMSVNPDAVDRSREIVYEMERKVADKNKFSS